jgi:hypothetical protein
MEDYNKMRNHLCGSDKDREKYFSERGRQSTLGQDLRKTANSIRYEGYEKYVAPKKKTGIFNKILNFIKLQIN